MNFIRNLLIFIFVFNGVSLESRSASQNQPSRTQYEIDKQVACSINQLGGGFYSDDLDAIIPLQPERVHTEWKKIKNQIAKRIGKITPAAPNENRSWRNTAQSIDELLKDAQILAPYFRKECQEIAKQTHSKANFGPENVYIIKSEESLERKVMLDAQELGISEEEAVAKIGDAIRGTIIVDSPERVSRVAAKIKEKIEKSGGSVFFRNYWEEERQSGYVGIHAKLFIPIKEKTSSKGKKCILAEVQIHLSCIMDGSPQCVKEREHLLYEQKKMDALDPEKLSLASKLLYLAALRKYYYKKDACSGR